MEKISSKEAQALLKTAATALRKLQAENVQLREKQASRAMEDRIVKVAKDMEDKDLSPELNFDEKVAALRESNLDVAEQATQWATPQGVKLASTGELPGAANSEQALSMFIMTGDSPE